MDCGRGPFTAHCDMRGNWTVFQRSFNGEFNSIISGQNMLMDLESPMENTAWDLTASTA